MNKRHIIDAMLETAYDLGLNQITIKEIESLGLSAVEHLQPSEICSRAKAIFKLFLPKLSGK